MLRNYVTIAVRTLSKQKGITAINVLGLASGMAVCLLVGLLLWDQVTHDTFHPGGDRIYRVTTDMQNNSLPFASSSAGLAPVLRKRVAGVDAATRFTEEHTTLVASDQGYDVEGLYAESSFFDVFGFELTNGDPEEALSEPYTVVLTTDLARRLFGDVDPMGKSVQLAQIGSFTVTGIVNRDAYRSHLPFEALYSFQTLRQTQSNDLADWHRSAFSYYTYLRLRTDRNPSSVEGSLEKIVDRHLPPAQSGEDLMVQGFELQALSSLPLGQTAANEISEGLLPARAGYFLAGLALLVLLAAGFNYVNLSTARSLTRSREVGVRKTVGAHRRQVVGQFVVEAIVVSLLALGLAVVLLQGLVPAYNQISIVDARIDVAPGLGVYAVFVIFALTIGAVAGLYPAWHLSKFHPSRVLKASVHSNAPGFEWLTPRKVLVVLQFAFAIVVSVSAVLVYRQAQHMSDAEYPIRMDGTASVELQDVSFAAFRQAALKQTDVARIGAASHLPIVSRGKTVCEITSDRIPDFVSPTYYALDYEAVKLLDLPLVATDDFTEARYETGGAVLISEAAVQRFGFTSPQQALGKPLTLTKDERTQSVRIAGIVRDFPLTVSLQSAEPIVFHHDARQFEIAVAGLVSQHERANRTPLREAWSQVDTVNPFDGAVLRHRIEEARADPLGDVGWLLGGVAGLAVLIGCLGLLGIATYTVQTRVREVGIRKALGATVGNLAALLSKDFLWLIGTAVALGLPFAWWVNTRWLQGFHYRIDLTPWTFVFSATVLLVLAIGAIGSQTIRVAQTDPATTLRDE